MMGSRTGVEDQTGAMRTIRRVLFPLVVGAALFLCRGAGATEFAVTGANWKPETLMLLVEGMAGHPGSVVLVRDADTHTLLGSAAVRGDGKWVLKIRNPANVPLRAEVEVGSKCLECDIEGAASAQ
jgi:hypothetical protein